MRYVVDGIKESPHPEEAPKGRLEGRTALIRFDPQLLYRL
jgi:hypothetical protein